MSNPIHNLPESLRRELLAAERLESGLTALLSRLEPPFGALERLLAKLQPTFHERELMLDSHPGMVAGPINFEQAVAAMRFDHVQAEQVQAEQPESDLLAAGLEEETLDATLEDETE